MFLAWAEAAQLGTFGRHMPSYFMIRPGVDDQPKLDELFDVADLPSVGSKPVRGVWYVRVDDDEDPAAPSRFVSAVAAAGISCSDLDDSEFWSSHSDPF